MSVSANRLPKKFRFLRYHKKKRKMEEVIEVVSNPRSVLPVKNRKYIRNTTEIHLAKRNIDRIENFDEFVNLEVLWLNGNRIRKLENLDENI